VSSLFDLIPPAAPPVEAVAARADPITSHQAAERMNRSGATAANAAAVLAMVRDHPGLTSRELSALPDCPAKIDRHEMARRTSTLERAGLVRKGDQRECGVGCGKAVTWFVV
jgi:hypothetical protein